MMVKNHVAVQDFIDKEKVYPGDTVRLHFLHPELLCFRVGDEFEIREGERVVAHGKISSILNLMENAEVYNR